MKNFIKIILLFFITLNAVSQPKKTEIESFLSSKISIRALVLDKNKLYFAGSENQFGSVDLKSKKIELHKIVNDTLKLEFRSIAQTQKFIFVLSVANPALLYKIDKKTLIPKLVYEERNAKVFYDSMQFLDNKFGVAMGDPIENGFCVITTSDGGETWTKTPDANLPALASGEGAFAASNSSLVIKKNKIGMASGGKKTRVFCSENFGKTWSASETPIIQGAAMTGIFTMDFYDQNIGFIAGGDYEKPLQNSGNKAITIDGGKTWNLVSENAGFGYASCVKFIAKSGGKKLVSVGAMGVYFSEDSGQNWKQISVEKDLYSIQILDEKSFIAAGRNKILKFSF